MGGSDGNIFNTKGGIESIVLGMGGARDVHSTKECLPISELVAAGGELARDLILAALDG